MKVQTASASFETLDRLEADTLLLFLTEDERPLRGLGGLIDWRMAGGLSRLLAREWVTGGAGEVVLAPGGGRIGVPRLLAIGLGPSGEVGADRLREAARLASRALKEAEAGTVACGLPEVPGLEPSAVAQAFEEGMAGGFEGTLTLLGDLRVLAELFDGRS